ncbi:unnamed protein product, partial [Pylaiella littoralis]
MLSSTEQGNSSATNRPCSTSSQQNPTLKTWTGISVTKNQSLNAMHIVCVEFHAFNDNLPMISNTTVQCAAIHHEFHNDNIFAPPKY